jgi:hypothetical protein
MWLTEMFCGRDPLIAGHDEVKGTGRACDKPGLSSLPPIIQKLSARPTSHLMPLI